MATKNRPAPQRDDYTPDHEGDVLGISDADPAVPIPQHKKPGGGPPQGLDVREPATGIGDVSQTPGATGIDMGGGGEGTGVTPHSRRPKSAEPDDTD